MVLATVLGVSNPSLGADNHRAGRLIGEIQSYYTIPKDSLVELARRFDLGFNALIAANPGVDPWVPPPGTRVLLPTAWILPKHPQQFGIVVNIPELRLYFFGKSGKVLTFPLGIGDQGWDTPLGLYTITEKIKRPVWHVPRSVRQENPRLPKVVPPGADNPLGTHALRLSRGGILIHGTNRPWGIGRRSSHGCLRLYPEDIVKLYKVVGRGATVRIVDQPVKVCTVGGRVFVEVHPHHPGDSRVGRALQMLSDRRLLGRTDFARLIEAVEEMKGMPVDVTLVP